RAAALAEDGGHPWEALNGWFERLIDYIGTKRALAHELLNYLDHDAPLFQVGRTSLFTAGEPLLTRAQEAGGVHRQGAHQRARADGPPRAHRARRAALPRTRSLRRRIRRPGQERTAGT